MGIKQRYILGVCLLSFIVASGGAHASPESDKMRAALAKNNIRWFATAVDRYHLDTFAYPTTAQGLAALMAAPTTAPVPKGWNGPYIDSSDKDLFKDPWGNPYQYRYENKKVDIFSYGADGAPGGEGVNADIHLAD